MMKIQQEHTRIYKGGVSKREIRHRSSTWVVFVDFPSLLIEARADVSKFQLVALKNSKPPPHTCCEEGSISQSLQREGQACRAMPHIQNMRNITTLSQLNRGTSRYTSKHVKSVKSLGTFDTLQSNFQFWFMPRDDFSMSFLRRLPSHKNMLVDCIQPI